MLAIPAMIFFGLLLAKTIVQAHESSYEHILWDVHPEPMPFAVSDLSATYVKATNLIYLMGGCDNADGNIRAPWDEFLFFCPSVTDRVTIFDVNTGTFEAGPPAPSPRYRHAAVHDGFGRIWLIGGRDADDNLVTDIDIFDTSLGEWLDTSNLQIPTVYETSDNAAFADVDTGMLYVAGGYDANYTAVTNVFAIDAKASLASGTLQYDARQSL